jgi:hypothetical protein
MLRRPNRSQTGGGLRNVSLSVQKHFVLVTDIWTWIIPFGSKVGRKEWHLRKPRVCTSSLFVRGNVGKYCSVECESMAKTPHIDCLCAYTECKGNTESIASSLLEIPF